MSVQELSIRLLGWMVLMLAVLVSLPVHAQDEKLVYLPLINDKQPIIVDIVADDQTADERCSLREAIQAANSDSPVDACPAGSGTDIVMLASGVYTLTLSGANEDDNATGDLDITGNLFLIGSSAQTTIVDGNHSDRVLHIHEGAHVHITEMTIRNGVAPSRDTDEQDSLGGADGGGIYNHGSLLIQNSIITGNYAGFGGIGPCEAGSPGKTGGYGGGVYNQGTLVIRDSTIRASQAGGGGVNICMGPGAPPVGYGGSGGSGGGVANLGTLTLTNSTISDNAAGAGAGGGSHGYCGGGGYGGGIFNNGDLAIRNSTISQNATGSGGGCFFQPGGAGGAGGGVANFGTVRVENSTITGNSTGVGGGGLGQPVTRGDGGGLYNTTFAQAVTGVKNTILAANITDQETADCSGLLTSYGYNLVQDTSGCTITGTLTGNILGQEPALSALANNGGPTQTHAIEPDSPAIDAGECTDIAGNAVTRDQRDIPRPQGSGCDIGAYELQH